MAAAGGRYLYPGYFIFCHQFGKVEVKPLGQRYQGSKRKIYLPFLNPLDLAILQSGCRCQLADTKPLRFPEFG